MKFKVILGVLGLGLITSSFADSITVESSSKLATSTAVAPLNKSNNVSSNQTLLTTKAKFTIQSNAKLTVQLIDNCWDNREDKVNQKIIADYLITQPKVPNDFETAWKLARLVYFIGNYGVGEKRFVDTKDGVKLFKYGADAGQVASELKPKNVEGYYWYAIDLGSYGLAKGILSAAANAGDGMDALKKANELDPTYHWNGSDRILGRYYQELPGLFGGSNKKALAKFNEATTKSPEFDNNWLFLGRFYNSDGQYDKGLDACKKALTVAPVDGKFEEMRYKREAKECIKLAQEKLK